MIRDWIFNVGMGVYGTLRYTLETFDSAAVKAQEVIKRLAERAGW